MFEGLGPRRRRSLIVSVGWLFADLLLVLAVVFLAANTFAPKKTQAIATPTTVPTHTITPTPTPVGLLLDKNRVTLVLVNINPDKLSRADQGAVSDLEQKIKGQIMQMGLQNRRAGIAIAYGGANNLSQTEVDRASSVAAEVYKVLDMLGQEKFVFCGTVPYDALFTTLHHDDQVVIDIYMFNKSVPDCSQLK